VFGFGLQQHKPALELNALGENFYTKNARNCKKHIFRTFCRVYNEVCYKSGGNGLHSLFSDARRSEVLALLQIFYQDCGNFWV